jgi:hypothetical protein
VVDYHALGRCKLLHHGLLMRPQLNGGTLIGRVSMSEAPIHLVAYDPGWVAKFRAMKGEALQVS